MQKSTGPDPSLSRVNAAIDGLCAAVLRNSEVTLSAKETSVWGGPGGQLRVRRLGRPARGSAGRPYIRRPRWPRSTRVTEVWRRHALNEWTVVVR
ncbi:hypothetical protein GCM10010254_12270 [Streptomyces chromofuscus]|nr:hypothetical protein GCM10010254_12270 [Streptomyces chromofuscus]